MESEYPTRIFLTGFMGSGKSTIGPILANVIGYDFLDLDSEIESETGRSIPEIFAASGEKGFRAIESEMIRRCGAKENIVVALGGGALTVEENLAFALENGLVVYLRLSKSSLQDRLRRSKRRPLLRDAEGNLLSQTALEHRIEDMLERRRRFYEQAHIIVDLEDDVIGLTVDHVVRALRSYRGAGS